MTAMTHVALEIPDAVQSPAGTEQMVLPLIGPREAVAAAQEIDPKLRRMIIRGTAEVLGIPCGMRSEVPTACDGRLSPGEIEAAASRGSVSGTATDDSLVCSVIDELHERGTLTDDTLRAMRGRFGDGTTRKLVLVVGLFNLMSLLFSYGRMQMKADDRIGVLKPSLPSARFGPASFGNVRGERDGRGDDRDA